MTDTQATAGSAGILDRRGTLVLEGGMPFVAYVIGFTALVVCVTFIDNSGVGQVLPAHQLVLWEVIAPGVYLLCGALGFGGAAFRRSLSGNHKRGRA
jgi:hypothetical protein